MLAWSGPIEGQWLAYDPRHAGVVWLIEESRAAEHATHGPPESCRRCTPMFVLYRYVGPGVPTDDRGTFVTFKEAADQADRERRLRGWAVTFTTVTPESAEEGDFDETGHVLEEGSFREALAAWWEDARGCHVEADTMPTNPCNPPRWFTACAGEPDYVTGAEREVSLHIPDDVTPASRLRLARLVGCYGA